MQFKHPEILWFLFLLIIPIIVHLFQLRRFRKEYFTNVRFLKELSIQTRKSSRLKKLLLLATRMLLLAALIFAFAQPFFKAKDSKGKSNQMYIVLDNSFSMQAKGSQGELLRRAVEDLLEYTPENSEFSLLTNSASFWNTDIKSVRRDLQNLSYSATPFDLEAQLAKVRASKSASDKDVVIITDGNGTTPNQLKGLGAGMNTWFVIPKAQQKSNVAIDTVFLQQTLDEFYQIAVTVSASGQAGEVPVALHNRGKLIAKTQVTLENEPETVTFTIPKEDFHGYASADDKGLAYDNTFYFSLAKPKKLNVLSIGAAARAGFMSKIYTHDEFIYQNFEPGSVDYNILDKQDAIILNELAEIPQALQTTLKSFVEKGGNLVIIPSVETTAAAMNSFLSHFGNVGFGAVQSKSQVTRISFNHPLYSGVFEKQVQNFQYPTVNHRFHVSGPAAAALAFEDQTPFLATLKMPASAVYVFAGAINRESSNFQNSPLIVPTFYNMAQTASKTGITALTIGDDVSHFVDSELAKDEVLKVENDRHSFIPVQQIMNNKVKLRFTENPVEAGNYQISKGASQIGNISFNYPRTEGIGEPHENIFSDYEVVPNVASVFDKLQADRTENEMWKWFVILALMFLITEIFIQKFVK